MSFLASKRPASSVNGPQRVWTRGLAYLAAVLVTAGVLWARLAVGYKAGDPLMLIVFLIPVLLSAYVGGLGLGLVSTLTAALGTAYYLVPPIHSFAFSS